MIRTAMVGKQPEKGLYRIRGGQLVTYSPYSEYLTRDFHRAACDYTIALSIQRQVEAGIDILSEGECLRDDYWQYILNYMDGLEKIEDPSNLGSSQWKVFQKPSIKNSFLGTDWENAQRFSTKPVKITIPGPLTLASYVDILTLELTFETLAQKFSELINSEIKDAVAKGCKNIQIDDPQLAIQTERAKEFGIELMGACFKGVPDNINKFLHVCRGYPDAETFVECGNKASEDCYLEIMPLLDKSPVNIISIENAFHPSSDQLFKMVENKILMLGVVNIKSNRVETPNEIKRSVEHVLNFIPKDRLILAPDCGCACAPKSFIKKMQNLVKAADFFR